MGHASQQERFDQTETTRAHHDRACVQPFRLVEDRVGRGRLLLAGVRARVEAGGARQLRALARLEAPRIVYVSCNPTTLASDLAVLRDEYGYELRRCTPVDMFPHTPHIETVALLERTGG